MQNLMIRKAGLADLESLGTVCSQTFIETYDGKGKDRPREMVTEYVKEKFFPEAVRAELNNQSFFIWVATLEGTLVGYFKLIREEPPSFVSNRNLIHLERIYVLERFHRKGIGKLLLKKAEELAAAHHFDGIWLGVWEENREAIEFYKRQGFTKVGSHNWEFQYKEYHYVDIDEVMVKLSIYTHLGRC